jgi:hypothetical protein
LNASLDALPIIAYPFPSLMMFIQGVSNDGQRIQGCIQGSPVPAIKQSDKKKIAG